jgi:hypothetical protein
MFQRYVASIYFQRFWQVPTFKQYFMNPVLFYKYIYPLVTIFKYETTTYNFGDLYRNKNVFPFVTGQRDLVQDKYFVPTVYNKDNKLYDQVYYKNLLEKIYNPLYTTSTDGDNVEVPTYFQDEILDKQVLSIEELYTTELFREYMNLPLFRQFWNYPMFQRYVASIYFQRFWQVPTFKQYFVNPVLFYKYIYPMVTIFKYDTTTYNYGDMYNKENKVYDQVYYKNLLDKVYNHLYTTSTYGDIDTIKTPFETIYGDKFAKDDLYKKMMYKKMYTPEVYGEENMMVPRTTTTDMYKFNPLVARMMYGNRRFNNFETAMDY